MKKYWYKTAMLVMALGVFTACSDDDGPKIPEGPIAPVNMLLIQETGMRIMELYNGMTGI